MTIFQRLILIFSILVILPASFITIFSYQKYVGEIESNMDRFISLLVQNVAVQADDNFNSFEQNALRFYSNKTVLEALVENSKLNETEKKKNKKKIYDENTRMVGQKLNGLAQENRNIVNILFITPKEQYYMINDYGFRRGGSVRDLEGFHNSQYYKKAVEQQGYPVWFDTLRGSDIFYANENNIFGLTDCITMSTAVYNPTDRTLLGVLIYNIDIDVFTDSMTNYSFYSSGNTMLIGQSGTILGINPTILEPNLQGNLDFMKDIQQNIQGSYSGNIDGTNVYLCYKKLSKANLYVTHIVNKDILMKPVHRIRNLCMIIVIFVMAGAVIVAYWTTISISRPLNSLMKTMHKFVDKNFDARYKITGRDEISVLGERFNEMADNTKQLIDRVYVSELNQKNLELNIKNAELNALQMQIHPHFLYNTLDIIRWEALYEIGGESKVSAMIDDFCKLMRLSIKSNADIVSLSEELTHAQTYIDVANFYYEENIKIILNSSLNTAEYKLPKLTLQPLMENAVNHGFGDKKGKWEIKINAGIEEEILVVSVEDNGQGMSIENLGLLRDSLAEDRAHQDSIGLRNVNQRYKLYFGEDYGIQINSELGKGTSVVLHLPI